MQCVRMCCNKTNYKDKVLFCFVFTFFSFADEDMILKN